MKTYLMLFIALMIFGAAGPACSTDQNNFLTGTVRDQLGRPIADARVRIMGGEEYVLTDTRGNFILPLKSPGVKFFQFPVSAGKEGWLNGGIMYRPGMRSLSLILQKVPDVDLTDYQMMITSPAGPLPQNLVMNRGMGMMARRDCGNCHTTHLWEWGASKMGKTALNDKVKESYRQFALEKRNDQAS